MYKNNHHQGNNTILHITSEEKVVTHLISIFLSVSPFEEPQLKHNISLSFSHCIESMIEHNTSFSLCLDPLPEHDPTGRTFYGKVCEKLGVVPVSYFARHITDPEIIMRFHGLGPHGTRAIARVLRVR